MSLLSGAEIASAARCRTWSRLWRNSKSVAEAFALSVMAPSIRHRRQTRLFSTYFQRWLHLQGVSCKGARGLAFPRLVPEAVRWTATS